MSGTTKRRFVMANATAPTAEAQRPAAPAAATQPETQPEPVAQATDEQAAIPAQPTAPPVHPVPRRGRTARREEPEERTPAWDARMSLTLTKAQKKALDMARVDDGLEGTARIRAMIALWESDEKLRRRIDKLAREYR